MGEEVALAVAAPGLAAVDGRGVRLLCESLAPPAQAGERVPGAGETPGGPEASLVDRIVELFDGEVLGPDPEKGNV